jgi:hypothetical protein
VADRIVGIRANPMRSSFVRADLGNSAVALECSWQQGSFIEKGGWATMPGGESANEAVAQACATMLSSLQK